MQIGSEMATLQEKTPKMDPKKRFFLKNPPGFLAFEKTEYWGLKDPLEVRVQHGTCIYMGDTFSRHFEPKKFNRVGRRGQKQPKWGIFGGTKIPPFWLFLAPPADPVEFFWFEMAGKGVPHIDTCSMLDSHLLGVF